MLVAQCNESCACISAIQQFSMCIASGGSFQTCALSNLANINTTGVDASPICAFGCATACGVMLPTDGGHPDASGEGGGEGGTEAGAD